MWVIRSGGLRLPLAASNAGLVAGQGDGQDQR